MREFFNSRPGHAVSDASEEIELSRLERAAEFMHGVRLTASGRRSQRGGRYIAPETKMAITEALSNSALVAAVKEAAQVDLPVNKLVERFEEMCRRQDAIVDAELRPAVAKLLATELWVNHIALSEPAKNLVSATLHQGAIAPELLKEYAEYPRYMVTVAMKQWPATSRETLRRANKEIAALAAEPEFQELANKKPSAFKYAAINSPLDTRSRLRKVAKKLAIGTGRM
jgi:hypothetical protein